MSATVSELITKLSGDTSDLDRKLSSADQSVAGFAKRTSQKALDITKSVGKIAGSAALAVAGFSLHAAIDFEASFANVKKTVNATDEELAKLRDTIRDMATNPENPLSAMENAHETLTEIMALGGQLGITTENLASFTETVGAMTVATNLGAEEAATFLAQFANVTGIDADQYRNVGNAIVELGNNMATTEADIAHFAQRIAPLATFDFSPEDILGYAAGLSSLGVSAELGGTNLLKTVGAITAAVATGEDLQGFADVAGMTATEFKNLHDNDPSAAFDAFIQGLGELDAADQIIQLQELGITSQEQVGLLQRMAGGWDTVEKALTLSNGAFEDSNALMDEATAKADTTQGNINKLKNNLTDLGISIGDKLLPGFNGFVEGLTMLASGNVTAGLDSVMTGVTQMVSDFFGFDWEVDKNPFTTWGENLRLAGEIISTIVNKIKTGIENFVWDVKYKLLEFVHGVAEMGESLGVVDGSISLGLQIEIDRMETEKLAKDTANEVKAILQSQMGSGDIDLTAGSGSIAGSLTDWLSDPAVIEQLGTDLPELISQALETAVSEGDEVSIAGLLVAGDLTDEDKVAFQEKFATMLPELFAGIDSKQEGRGLVNLADMIGIDPATTRQKLQEGLDLAVAGGAEDMSAEEGAAFNAMLEVATALGLDELDMYQQLAESVMHAASLNAPVVTMSVDVILEPNTIDWSAVDAAKPGGGGGGSGAPIPEFAGGGKYDNPSGAGFAWLHDQEVVLTPEQQATVAAALGSGRGGGDTFVVNSYGRHPYALVDEIDRSRRSRGRR